MDREEHSAKHRMKYSFAIRRERPYEDYAGEISKTIWNSPKWEDRNPKNGVLSVDASINPLKGLL